MHFETVFSHRLAFVSFIKGLNVIGMAPRVFLVGNEIIGRIYLIRTSVDSF